MQVLHVDNVQCRSPPQMFVLTHETAYVMAVNLSVV